jgi:type I site-specific restriction-modification system R (restriction) subunit
MKFTEAKLESAIIELLGEMGYPHVLGESIDRQPDEVLIKDDLRAFLSRQYAADGITFGEIESVIRQLAAYASADLYESNKAIMKLVSDGFLLKREDRDQKDLYVQLIDYSALIAFRKPRVGEVPEIVAEEHAAYGTDSGANIFKMVNQLEITGHEKRIPDGILYINGLPLVVFEFKSAIREEATIHDAFIQLTVRYRRDIPALFKYNAFCVISDGVNNKAGSFFAAYEFFYAWRKTDGSDLIEKDGIDSLYSMIHGLFHPVRLCDVIRNFIFLPDTSRREEKILCRYPQYYAATKLYQNILNHIRPEGDGKGGTYFGATGCGKSYTMLFLTRLLMKSVALSKRMKAAYDICVGSDQFTQDERDRFHFYMAVRSIIFKLTKGNAPDLSRMNARVRQMISDALKSNGVEEIFKMGQGDTTAVDIFDPDYLEKINKIKLPNTKIKMLQKLLSKAIDEFKKVNKLKGVNFAEKFKSLVERYNDRSEQHVLRSEVLEDFTDKIIDLYHAIRKERESFADMGIDEK